MVRIGHPHQLRPGEWVLAIGSLVVEQVTQPAASAGVQPGDVILGVSNERVANERELRSAIAEATGSVALLVQRGPAQIFIPVPVK